MRLGVMARGMKMAAFGVTRDLFIALMMEAVNCSEISISIYQITWCYTV
jgi:hypothetical protein